MCHVAQPPSMLTFAAARKSSDGTECDLDSEGAVLAR